MNKPTYLVYVLYDVRIIFSLNKLGHPSQVYNFFKMVSVFWSLRWSQFPLCPPTLSFLNCCTCCPKMGHSGKYHVSCLWWNSSSKHKLTLVSSLLLCGICVHRLGTQSSQALSLSSLHSLTIGKYWGFPHCEQWAFGFQLSVPKTNDTITLWGTELFTVMIFSLYKSNDEKNAWHHHWNENTATILPKDQVNIRFIITWPMFKEMHL